MTKKAPPFGGAFWRYWSPSVQQRERLQDGRGRNVGRMLLKLLERCSGRAIGEI